MSASVVSENEVVTAAPTMQQITITGTVTDDVGDPLPGVNVVIKGTSQGTGTNADGTFSINVPDGNAVLVFSYVGFSSKEIRVGASRTLTVILSEDTQQIDEVVVIGYGIQKKVNLTGAVASVNVDKEIQSRPLTNLSQALSGMTAGLQVMQGSGQPNSDNFSLRIRGIGTLNNANPLVLVDGMEQDFRNVNPNDVASISILKDAASCAIYGNRAANGVILITTKKGEKGKVRVTYSGNFSFNQPSNLIQPVTNSADFFELMNESRTNIGQSVIFSKETIDKFRAAEKNPNGIDAATGYPNYVVYPNTDWYKTVFENKMQQEHTFSILGANERVNFNFSGSMLDNPGLVDGTGEQKFYVRSNVIAHVTDWLQVGNRTYGFINELERNNLNEFLTSLGSTKSSPAIYPFYDGKYGAPEASEEDPQALNIVQWLHHTGGGYTYSQINTSMFADVTLFKDLIYHINFEYTRYWREDLFSTKSTGRYSFRTDQWVIPPPVASTLETMFYTMGRKRRRFEQTLNYNKTFNVVHEVGALAGYEEMYFRQYEVDAQKMGLIDESITDLSTATTMRVINGTNTDNASRSFFGRVTYAYDSRYLFEANMRYDGSSLFSPDSRWGLFPSFSGAWRISQEGFMANSPFNNLKLRASWGKLGNNGITDNNYPWQSTYGANNYAFGNALVNGLAQTALSNSLLQWETTTQTNLGLDFSILNNRLAGEIDVYNRYTDGILYRPSIYATMGDKTAAYENIAELSNKGIEITLGWTDRINKFNYGVKGNFSYNKNKVAKYRGELVRGWGTNAAGDRVYQTNLGDVSTGTLNRVIEGKIYNEFYTMSPYKGTQNYFNTDGSVDIKGGPKDGMIRTEKDLQWLQAMRAAGYQFYPNQSVTQNGIWYGDYIYADLNEDGLYGNTYDYDFQNCSVNPKYNYGLQAFASWNNFDLSMNWMGAAGFSIYYYDTGRNSTGTIYGYLISQSIADDHYFFDPANPNDSRTNLTSKNSRLSNNGTNSQSSAQSTLHLEKGDFLKLKNLTIGYTIPANIAKKAYLQNARIFVSGENLLTITGFSGMDPEMQRGFQYVTMRQLAFGVNVTF